MIDTLRLFIAAELPDEVREVIGRVQGLLQKEIDNPVLRWAHLEGIHLTIKFLGDVPVDQVDDIQTALDEAISGHAPFDLEIAGMGCFPNIKHPNVIWLGLDGNIDALIKLQTAVEMAMSRLGFSSETRDYTPHLTLARVRNNARKHERVAIGEKIEEWQEVRVTSWQIKGISVMRSDLRPTGAEYTQLHYVELEA